MTEFRLNRLFSGPLTRLLLLTPLTPNHVTTLSLLFGVAAGWFFSRGEAASSLTAAFCYQTAVILDNCDGEIARAKNMRSRFGSGYDIAVDFVTDIALFSGVTAGALRAGVQGPVLLFGALCLSGAVMHMTLVLIEKIRGFGPAEYAAPHPEHQTRKDPFLTVFDCLREGDASWIVILFAALGRTDWLLWCGGVYMQAIWIAAFVMNFRWLFGVKK